ncbi:hypothetical protein M434DRAFT_28199 [Hypoxylon sp. CO27-5]|nr:hypothetical protein M434DRAFT_28199 [Hypoxylon sp. CO27-5]
MSSGKAWSQQEKICFLVQIVEQLSTSKGGIPYKKVDLPGRTEKSMTHTWGHLRAEAAAFRQALADGQEATGPLKTNGNNKRAAAKSTDAAPRRSSRKRTHSGPYLDSLSDDDEDKVPVKKARLSSDEKTLSGSQDMGEDTDQTLADATKAGQPSLGIKDEDNIKIEYDDDDEA